MSSRFIKPILQISKLSREKFIINKKNYIESILNNRQKSIQKNYNKIITRNISTSTTENDGGGNDPNNFMYMVTSAIVFNIYIILKKSTNGKEE